jgi:hypothetical protein
VTQGKAVSQAWAQVITFKAPSAARATLSRSTPRQPAVGNALTPVSPALACMLVVVQACCWVKNLQLAHVSTARLGCAPST